MCIYYICNIIIICLFNIQLSVHQIKSTYVMHLQYIKTLHWSGNLIVQSFFRNPSPKKPWPGPTGSCNLAWDPNSMNSTSSFTWRKPGWSAWHTSRTFHKDGCFRAASLVDSMCLVGSDIIFAGEQSFIVIGFVTLGSAYASYSITLVACSIWIFSGILSAFPFLVNAKSTKST